MDRGWITGDKRVPGGQILSFMDKAIGAGSRQPFDFFNIFSRELETVIFKSHTAAIFHAATAAGIKERAGHIGIVKLPAVFILNLVKAAKPATVA